MRGPERTPCWDCRGMVVGSVQSGKTANYCGLICKAIDSGYRLVVSQNRTAETLQIRMKTTFSRSSCARIVRRSRLRNRVLFEFWRRFLPSRCLLGGSPSLSKSAVFAKSLGKTSSARRPVEGTSGLILTYDIREIGEPAMQLLHLR